MSMLPTAGSEDILLNEVKESKTNDKNKEKVTSIIKRLNALANFKEATGDTKTAQNLRKEIQEVRDVTINSLRDCYSQTQDTLNCLKSEIELTDKEINNLSNGSINDQDLARIEKEFNQVEELVNKPIDPIRDIVESDAKENNGGLLSSLPFASDSANYIANKISEQKLKTIYGAAIIDEGWTHYEGKIILHAYNDKQGNHIIDFDDFSMNLKALDPTKWNSLAFVNYIKCLKANNNLSSKTLIDNLGATNIVRLQELWSKSESLDLAKNKLLEDSQLAWVVNGIQNIEDFTGVITDFSDLDDICEIAEALPDGEKKEILRQRVTAYIKNNGSIVNEEWKKYDKDAPLFLREIMQEIRFSQTLAYIRRSFVDKYADFPNQEKEFTQMLEQANQGQKSLEDILDTINIKTAQYNRVLIDQSVSSGLIPHIKISEKTQILSLVASDKNFDRALKEYRIASLILSDNERRISELQDILKKEDYNPEEEAGLRQELQDLLGKLDLVQKKVEIREEKVDVAEKISEKMYSLATSGEFSAEDFLRVASESDDVILNQFVALVTQNSISSVSDNLGNIALSSINEDSPIYDVIRDAKIQEFNRELDEKAQNSPEILEMKQDMIQALTLKFGTEVSSEHIERVFEAVLEKIRSNPTEVDSLEALTQVFDENADLEHTMLGLGTEAVREFQASINAAQEKIESGKYNEGIIIFQKLLEMDPRDSEAIVVAKEALIQVGINIETLRDSNEYLKLVEKIGAESLEMKLLLGTIPNKEEYEKAKAQLQAENTDIGENNDSTLDNQTQDNHEGAISVVSQVENTLTAMENASTNQEKIEAADQAKKLGNTLDGEANINVGATVLKTLKGLQGNEVQKLQTKMSESLSENLKNPLLGQSEYAQKQVNELKEVLGSNNPFIIKITNAQEEGIQNAYNTDIKIAKTLSSLPPHVHEFYGDVLQTITVQSPEIISSITLAELKTFRNNPDAVDNFIQASEYFIGCNMPSAMIFRNEFAVAMGQVGINLGDDSLKHTELINYGKNIASFCSSIATKQGNPIHMNVTNITTTEQLAVELNKFSRYQELGGNNRKYNIHGDDRLANWMRKEGFFTSTTFPIETVRSMMKGKNTVMV